MLRRQKHVLSQSTTPFACTLGNLYPHSTEHWILNPLITGVELKSIVKQVWASEISSGFIGENQKGTVGRGREIKCHDNLRHFTTTCGIL